MSKFTKTYSVITAIMLLSIVVIGQSIKNDNSQKLQLIQEQLTQDIQPGVTPVAVSQSDFDYTKIVNSDGTKNLLWDNGPLLTNVGGGAGGADLCALQASLGMNTLGGGFQISAGNSIADEFDVTSEWTVTTITFYAYQSFAGTTSTMNALYFQIWDGDPSSGGSVIWGDLATDRLISTDWTNMYRASDASPQNADRAIMNVVGDASGLILAPGTYWVEVMVGGTAASGPWCPPISILGETTTGNAKQHTTATGWADWEDTGTLTGLGLPFIIDGDGGGSGSTVAFFDDFESGISNWTVTGAWGITNTQSYSPSNSLTDSPGGNYLANQEIYATMATGVDLSDPALLSASVDWWMIMDIENGNFDYLYVEVSTDNFATYVQIASFFGEDLLNPWVQYTYPMGAFLGNSNVKVRFHFSSDGGYEVDGCYIDDFSIITSDVDNAAPEIFFDPPFAYEGSLDDFVVEAEILDASGVASAEVMYTVDGVTQTNVAGVDTGDDIWTFTIPQQDPGYQVNFVISATDASSSSNVMITDTASYIAGNYLKYDNAVVDFYTSIAAPGGTAVVFPIENPTQLVTALIRNYTDQSQPPNDQMLVHIWADGGNGPGADLIDPILMYPEANLVNTRAFTRVDLRPYASELSNIIGNVFIGYTVPNGIVLTTTTSPGVFNHSFTSTNGTTWNTLATDYHFRLITGEEGANPYPAPENVTAMLEGLNDVSVDWDEPGSGGQTPLEGYNVLRDGVEIAYVAVPNTEYTDMALEPDTYEYCVTAVYEDGESFEVCADPVTVNPGEPPPAPTNLVTEVVGEDIVLTWDAPGDEWMQWDSGENNGNGIGLTGGGTMVVSSHWDPVSLIDYNGLTLTQIQFFPNADPSATFTIKVWTGTAGTNEVLSQAVTSYVVDEWNTVDLNTPVTIDGTQDLWFGYSVLHGASQFPAGCDDGPAIAGYGDMIISGGAWVSLVSLAPTLDFNWNLAGYVVAMDGTTQLMGKPMNPSSASGDFVASGPTGVSKKMNTAGNKSFDTYNVYYSFDGGAFAYVASTTETTFTHSDAGSIIGEHCYEVTAVYDPQGESDPTNESCQIITSVSEFLLNATAVYPNPASDVINIKSDFEIEFIRVYNHAGQIVTDQLINNTIYQLNTSEFNSGLYLFQIRTTEGTITKRIIIQ